VWADPLFSTSIFAGPLRLVLDGAEPPHWYDAGEHVVAHRDAIRELLESNGWFAADRAAKRAEDRLEVATRAAMDAPAAHPVDLLAKLEMFQKPAEWQEEISDMERGANSFDLEGQMLLAAYRDLRAMVSPS